MARHFTWSAKYARANCVADYHRESEADPEDAKQPPATRGCARCSFGSGLQERNQGEHPNLHRSLPKKRRWQLCATFAFSAAQR
jgi:hypothetical protein